MSMLLEVSGVSVTFDGFRAINNLSINFAPAELRAIIGPNGAGKTTTLRSILGLTPARAGSIRFDGRDVTRESQRSVCFVRAARGEQGATRFRSLVGQVVTHEAVPTQQPTPADRPPIQRYRTSAPQKAYYEAPSPSPAPPRFFPDSPTNLWSAQL